MGERFVGFAVAVAILAMTLIATSGTARAAVERPAYSVGDRWVYNFEGALHGLPGFNDTIGTFSLVLTGRVEVEVTALRDTGEGPPAVEVLTETSGTLIGTFTVPGTSFDVSVTGSLTSDTFELWEGEGFFPIESNGRTLYVAGTPPPEARVDVRLNAKTAVTLDGAAYPLDVGESASAALRTNLTANTTISAFGNSTSFENTTIIDSSWRRDVLAQETVTVEAGVFAAYRLNQTLGAFPGLPAVGAIEGANETAYFSNDVGNYVRRTAYLNGSEAAEMRLRSYTYAARATSPLSLPILLLLIAVPIVTAAGILVWILRRRQRRSEITPGGGPDAR